MESNAKVLQKIATDIRLLYVEDDDDVRKSIHETLSFFFKHIDVAINGEDGLALYEKNTYDLVLSDIRMPKMNGIEMTRHIKAINSEQMIMIISAHDEADYLMKLINLGVHSFVLKPVEIEKLIETLIPLCTIIYERQELELYRVQQVRFNAIRELLNNIAHQWRQPLNILAANLQNMEMLQEFNELDDEQIRQSIQKSMKLIMQMSAVIDSFHTAFDNNIEDEEFSIVQSINNALKIISDTMQSNGIKISLDFQKDSTLMGKQNEFQEVILHLLNNAMDAFKKNDIKNSEINIKTEQIANKAIISIADNASGIDIDTLQSIFEPYSTTKFKSEGIGMGLFIAKTTIMHHMGGNLELKNINDGVTCIITLPITEK